MNKIKQLGFFFTSLAFFIVLSLFATKNVSASTVSGFQQTGSGSGFWGKIIDYKYTATGQNNINHICLTPFWSGGAYVDVSVYINSVFAGTLVGGDSNVRCIDFSPIGGTGYANDDFIISVNRSGNPDESIMGNGMYAFDATVNIGLGSYLGTWADGNKVYFYYPNQEEWRALGYIQTSYDDGYIPPNPPIGSNVYFAKELTCYIGQPCYYQVNAENISINGWKSYFSLSPNCAPISNHPEYTLASTTIANGHGILEIPATTTQSIINGKISSKSADGSLAECSDVAVYWEEDPATQDLFYDKEKLHALCGDIATSTGGMLDDVRFALECAVRASFYYLFYPDKSVTSKITDNFDNLKIRFPFSAYFDLTNEIDTAFSSSSIDKTGLSFPMIRKTSTSTEFYMLPVMSSTSISNAIGEYNAEMFRNLFTIIIWSSMALIIYLTIRK